MVHLVYNPVVYQTNSLLMRANKLKSFSRDHWLVWPHQIIIFFFMHMYGTAHTHQY